MNVEEMAGQLESNIEVIRQLADVSVEQARWRPAPGKWSLLEVVNHLHDEELEDFRPRVDLTLHHPDKPWPPFDPQAWPEERKYNERDLGESIGRLAKAREESLAWLKALDSPDWQLAREHPRLGTLRAGDFMASWVTHDFLHIRQLNRLRLAWANRLAEPFDNTYAAP